MCASLSGCRGVCIWICLVVMQNVCRFRLRGHILIVETACRENGILPVCDQCSCRQIQDEACVLFMCRCEGLSVLRQKYSDLYGDFSPAHSFLQHQSSVQAVSNFLLRRNKKLFYFMSFGFAVGWHGPATG
eukprot:1137467-Pelagomonas_calceolata.AAC.1